MIITENCKKQNENDKIRMEIFRDLVGIYNTEYLNRVKNLTYYLRMKEIDKHPFSIVDIAEMMDVEDVAKIMDVLRGMDITLYPYNQMYEVFSNVLGRMTETKGE